jgi:hypothetical protein
MFETTAAITIILAVFIIDFVCLNGFIINLNNGRRINMALSSDKISNNQNNEILEILKRLSESQIEMKADILRIAESQVEMKAEITGEITGINTKITGISSEIMGINAKITGISSEMTGINAKITGVSSEMTGVRKEIVVMAEKSTSSFQLLINYNSNRDKELEETLDEVLLIALEDLGWNSTRIDLHNVYNSSNHIILEWDGIYSSHHIQNPDSTKRLFIVETKQVFRKNKFFDFKERFEKMRNFLTTVDPDNAFFPFRDHLLCGVVASPTIKFPVDLITESNFSSITLKRDVSDQYEVKLVIR